jgi:hypothetical protein
MRRELFCNSATGPSREKCGTTLPTVCFELFCRECEAPFELADRQFHQWLCGKMFVRIQTHGAATSTAR